MNVVRALWALVSGHWAAWQAEDRDSKQPPR